MPTAPLVVDAVLFDMDGTLVDSNATVDAMWTQFAITLDLDPVAVRRFAHGTPSTATLGEFLPDGEDFDEWFTKIAVWEGGSFGHVGEVTGAIRVVKSLPVDRWAVVTSALREAARTRLKGVGFADPRVLIGADDVSRGKPDPEGFLAAARALGVDPSHCVVFEDSPAGLEAALASGAIAIVVGDNDAPVTRGLRRLRDWTGVTVTVNGEGRLVLEGVPEVV